MNETWEVIQSSAAAELPFRITVLEFDNKTGQINTNTMMATTSKGENYKFAVLDDEDGKDDGIIDDDGTAFRHEKKFKLSVI